MPGFQVINSPPPSLLLPYVFVDNTGVAVFGEVGSYDDSNHHFRPTYPNQFDSVCFRRHSYVASIAHLVSDSYIGPSHHGYR